MIDEWTGKLPDGRKVRYVSNYVKGADTTHIIATMAGTELEIVRLRKGKLNRKQVELEFKTEELD